MFQILTGRGGEGVGPKNRICKYICSDLRLHKNAYEWKKDGACTKMSTEAFCMLFYWPKA